VTSACAWALTAKSVLNIQDLVAVLDILSNQVVTATRLFHHQLVFELQQRCRRALRCLLLPSSNRDNTPNNIRQAGDGTSCAHAL